MDNDKILKFDRLFKLQTVYNRLAMEGKRDPDEVSNFLQKVIERPQFFLVDDLGIITIPGDYQHENSREYFQKRIPKIFVWWSEESLFKRASRILHPGDMLHVRIFGDSHNSTGSSAEDKLEFLEKQHAVYPGIQGMYFVVKETGQRLKSGYEYLMLDKEKNLYGYPGPLSVPTLRCRRKDTDDWEDDFCVQDSTFKDRQGSNSLFFCFTEVKA